jgi:hypothetical protein
MCLVPYMLIVEGFSVNYHVTGRDKAMSTVMEHTTSVEQAVTPEWTRITIAQQELGLTRYLFKQLRRKYRLRIRRTTDGRVKLVDLAKARQCLEQELAQEIFP